MVLAVTFPTAYPARHSQGGTAEKMIEGNACPALSAVLGALLLCTAGVSAGQTADHSYSSESVATGYRIYAENCALCHGLEGNWIEAVDLSRNQFRTVVTDHDLKGVIETGAADGRMPSFDFSDDEIDGIIAYIRVGFDPEGAQVKIGDAAEGEVLFRGKAACSTCHRVNGQGPRTAPDLSDIGALRTPGALKRSLVDPTSALLPINRPVTLVTRDGEIITGRRLNEDTYTVQLIDSKERLLSLSKSDLAQYEVSTEPTHRPTSLSNEEVADLIAYMLSLRGEN